MSIVCFYWSCSQGVPGFFIGKDGKWTVRFNSILAGFIIPIKGVDGRIRGAQIRMDVPLKNEDDDPEKEGSKYVWLSSAGKEMGVFPGVRYISSEIHTSERSISPKDASKRMSHTV